MRKRDILIFLSVVFAVYSAINILLFYKGRTAAGEIIGEGWYTLIFILLSATFVAGKVLERSNSSVLSDILNLTGGFWLSFMLYSVLLIALSDLGILILKLSGAAESADYNQLRKLLYQVSFSLSVLLIIAGFINTTVPVIRKYTVNINKPAGNLKHINIMAVSDIHLGSVYSNRSMRLLSESLRKAAPDILLFLGDIVDGEIQPVLRTDPLASLKIPPGTAHVYAITGNHEYIGGFSQTVSYIEDNNIKVLLDELITIDNNIQIIGRKDRDSMRYSGKPREKLEVLLGKVDQDKPVIVLDHQPPLRKEKGEKNFDLMLSGHTHNGQMWPLNYLTKLIYKYVYGKHRAGDTYYIVSSGYGGWGPRVRLGSRPEILEIKLCFKGHTEDTASSRGSNFLR